MAAAAAAALALAAVLAPSLACVFHCGSTATLCGGRVGQTNAVFEFWYAPPRGTEFALNSAVEVAVDLRGRNITSIAPGGLGCFSNALRGVPPVLLDNNALTALPDLSGWPAVFGSITYISMTRNKITALPSGAFSKLYTDNMWIDLSFNEITSLPDGAFTFSGEMLAVNLTSNAIAGALCNETLTSFQGSDLSLVLARNRIESVAPGAFNVMSSSGLWLDLSRNSVTFLPNGTFDNAQMSVLNLDLSHNKIAGLGGGALSFVGNSITEWSTANVELSNNRIVEWPPMLLDEFGGLSLQVDATYVTMANNSLTFLPGAAFASGPKGELGIDLTHNQITGLSSTAFNFLSANNFVLNVSCNLIESLSAQVFSGMNYKTVTKFLVSMTWNKLTSLPDDLWYGCSGQYSAFALDCSNNDIQDVGAIFGDHFVGNTVEMILSSNRVNTTGLVAAVQSFTSGSGYLYLTARGNRITELPPGLLSMVGYSSAVVVGCVLDLAFNPITAVSGDVFVAKERTTLGLLVVVDISFPTAGPVSFPSSFALAAAGVSNFWPGTTLQLGLAGTGADASVVSLFRDFLTPFKCEEPVGTCAGCCGPTCNLTFDLSHNNLTAVRDNEFAAARLTQLDLSRNAMTWLSGSAFNYSFDLLSLDVSHNNLTWIPQELQSNLPVLQNFSFQNNSILALPLFGNHVRHAKFGSSNTIECDVYGPTPTGCRCAAGFTRNTHCQYVRCTPADLKDGCPNGTLFNSSDCTTAPWSACVNPAGVFGRQFYRSAIDSFEPVTQCRTAFPDPAAEGRFYRAYQVRNFSATSDRLCSICSSCPAGFVVHPCTATSNTRCTRSARLSAGDIAALVLAGVVLLSLAAVAFLYGQTQKQVRKLTENELEMTHRELDGMTQEKDRFAKETELMSQAWSISGSDLNTGRLIGIGASGRVFEGFWGHIPVAIKVYHVPVNDLDPELLADFNSEVAFMRSLRHPNLLSFYGAGVTADSNQAFVVTELMKCSLQALLLDVTRSLSWSDRLTFASDIVAGMAYLHSKGAVHRDLKAENCFVDENLRCKVGDFGTGKASRAMWQATDGAGVANGGGAGGGAPAVVDRGRSLSGGAGSLLWMSPEALRGDRIREGNAPALDVFSFGVALFEIWARVRPWEEIDVGEAAFAGVLRDRVTSGRRPSLPDGAPEAPSGFRDLMEACWSDDPCERPPFEDVAGWLATIRARLGAGAVAAAVYE